MRAKGSILALLAVAALALLRQGARPPVTLAADPPKVYGEWRIRVKPDKGAEYAQLIKEKGLPLFREAGGRMVGWWTTLIGDLYEHVTIWEYDGLPAFEKAVQFLGKDERFAKFTAARDPLLDGEESRFLKLADFAEKPSLPDASKLVVHEVHRVPADRMRDYLQLMVDMIPLLKKHGLNPMGPLQTVVGRWSEVTYLFSFESLAEREKLNAEFLSSGESKRYTDQVTRFAQEVTTRVLAPAPFAK
jgi:hypothetical protein